MISVAKGLPPSKKETQGKTGWPWLDRYRSTKVRSKVSKDDGSKEKSKEIKRYTQRAKQGVLRKRVLLPPGLKAKRSEPQLNFTQPEEREDGRKRRREEVKKRRGEDEILRGEESNKEKQIKRKWKERGQKRYRWEGRREKQVKEYKGHSPLANFRNS